MNRSIAPRLLEPLPQPPPLPSLDVSRTVCAVLAELGVRQVYGLVGGAIAPFSEALGKSELQVFHCRHECGAGYAAVEAHFASGLPTAVFVTTGPGVTNALTGMAAARWEGAKVVLISGMTSSAQRGRWACQETSSETMPLSGIYGAGPLFHYAATLEHPSQLDTIAARLAHGFSRPEGFVAHLALPLSVQSAPLERPVRPVAAGVAAGMDSAAADELVSLFASKGFAIWAGFGARGAAAELRALAELTGAPVMCSPRAKGVFPEDHPLYLGSTGLGGHASVDAHFAAHRPAHLLVLGTRLAEPTSFWSEALLPTELMVHVDVDPSVAGAAYPAARTLFVQAEIRSFVRMLLARLPRAHGGPRGLISALERPPHLTFEQSGPVRPQALMQAIQEVIIEGTDAVVMTESGNSFAWGNHLLRFREPGRYRVSTGYGAMGHAAAGVVGAALGRGGKAVAVLGDGAMLMGTEVSTAVQYGAQAVWVVLNDGRYNMVEQGMTALGFQPLETRLPDTDFVQMARGAGADGIKVAREDELVAALEAAMAAEVPFVVDVRISPDARAPWMRRIQNLILQGAEGSGGEA